MKLGQRKASPITFSISMVLLLVILIVLVIFQSELFTTLKLLGSENACKTSVYLHSRSKLSGYNFMQNAELDCPTNYIKLSKEKDILPTVAHQLYSCWDNFGQGRLELFSQVDNRYCHVCSVIEFEGFRGTKPGILRYLATKKPVGKDMTYFEFLHGVRFSELTDKQVLKYIDDYNLDYKSINLEQPLSMMFVYDKTTFTDKKQAAIYGAGAGAVALGSVAAYKIGWAGISFIVFTVNPLIAFPTLIAGGIAGGAIAGGVTGYMFGADQSADWNARLLMVPFDKTNIKKLGCTELPIKGEAREITIS